MATKRYKDISRTLHGVDAQLAKIKGLAADRGYMLTNNAIHTMQLDLDDALEYLEREAGVPQKNEKQEQNNG